MSEKTIYNDLRKAGLTHAGACGLMGNFKAESAMKSNIVQRSMQSKSDEDYTIAFDANPDKYIYDAVGYGLAQWTFWSRKKNLWQFSKNWGVSVGAEDMQTAFAVWELKNEYTKVWQTLCATDSVDTAADIVCTQYERPAVNNLVQRRGFAAEFDRMFKNSQPEQPQYVPMASLSDIADQLEELAKILRGFK